MIGVVPPAFAERDGQVAPLVPGAPLRPGDGLLLGPGARAMLQLGPARRAFIASETLLRLPDGDDATVALESGAVVLLGDAPFALSSGPARILSEGGGLGLRRGPPGMVAVLVHGSATVEVQGQEPVALEGAGSVWIGPAADPPYAPEDIIAVVNDAKLEAGMGVMVSGGGWMLVVASMQDEAVAVDLVRQIARAGYPASIRPVVVDGTRYHRALVSGFASEADAQRIAERMQQVLGLAEAPWVTPDRAAASP